MPRQQAPTSRRDALIQGAFAGVARRGMEGLRLRPVAEAAGIDHSTLHHYFRTKDDVVAALLAYATGRLEGTMAGARAQTPMAALHDHLQGLLQAMRSDPDLFIVLQELELHGRRRAEIGAGLEADEAGWRAALRGLLEGAVREGECRPDLDLDATVELIVATVKGARLDPDRCALAIEQLEALLQPVQQEGK